ncbi:universal stress protein [Phyllobacterium brassicacearum]|uniref:Universal stress protein n=1 Tax=Phyllobacterium brassicacearum TaxID=314235 RepID=A0A2P7BUA1_9HYPH|nr:universal stress protein [Phyllobacterium brassicacearum]PSH70046.1 universal stress protein [Phyllobacterium brassicacearum]TDQ34097.1 nucleotide-binding universal stress UspA family protein [Phyllobacterium brassicacearum]
MTYKTILANLNIDGPTTPLIEFSVNLAARFNAHLIGFSAADTPVPSPTLEGHLVEGASMRRDRQEIEQRLRSLREEFGRIAGSTVSNEWRDAIQNPTRCLVETSRTTDVIVMTLSGTASFGKADRSVHLGDLVLQAGRSVLIAARGARCIFANTALVAWRDTCEARRAILNAVPLLRQMREVVVATVIAETDGRIKQSLNDVTTYLLRHGVNARSEIIQEKHESRALLQFARFIDAELVVYGAYGHSKVRRMLFGGMTRSLLNEDGISRFMSC